MKKLSVIHIIMHVFVQERSHQFTRSAKLVMKADLLIWIVIEKQQIVNPRNYAYKSRILKCILID